MHKAILGAVAVVAAALLWSLDGFLRQQLYSLPPSVVVFWEHVVGLLVLSPIIISRFKTWPALTRPQWTSITLVALLSGALGTVLYTAALGRVQYISYSVVVLLQQLNPLFAVLAAGVLLKEKLTPKFLGLAALAVVGAYFVSFPQLTIVATGAGTFTAALLALGAAASWGTSTALSKLSLQGTDFLQITALRFALAPLFALLFILGLQQGPALLQLTAVQWQYVVAITFSTGLVALAIYYFGLQRIPASRSAILELAWPLSAAGVGFFFLQEHLTATQWLGALVLMLCMVTVARDARTVSTAPQAGAQ